jgi:hypothetical protein
MTALVADGFTGPMKSNRAGTVAFAHANFAQCLANDTRARAHDTGLFPIPRRYAWIRIAPWGLAAGDGRRLAA